MSTPNKMVFHGGFQIGGESVGRTFGHLDTVSFGNIASVGAGVALTTIQLPLLSIPIGHRVRSCWFQASAVTAVAGATDPAVAVYQHLPIPDPVTVALISPAAAGLVETGVHKYAVTFTSASGETMPSTTVSVTVADLNVNGKVTVSGIPLGPTGTTGRKLYRTLAGAETLTLLTTIADNTTTTYTDNTADGSLSGAVPTTNTAAFTILSATAKLSTATTNLVYQPVSGVMVDAAAPLVRPACIYSVRALTGASTGAITNLQAFMQIEYLS